MKSPWSWIPTLYFAEGIPNTVVMVIAVVMYKRLGLDNESIAFYTSWLYLPWVIKPFWSPIVDMFRTKRWWVLWMQFFIGASMAGVAFTLPVETGVQWSLAFFWLMAFSSATHDIAADGYYMLQLSPHEQALFVGIRSTFYRVANIAGQGLLIMLAGLLEAYTQVPVKAWSLTFFFAAAIFLLLCIYHTKWLPRPTADIDEGRLTARERLSIFGRTFATFFRKPQILAAIAFMLLYRFPEALLTKICPLFLLDKVDAGGLGLATSEIGLVQGTVGVIGLTLGGILGGIAVARDGFGKWLWPMVLSISLPNVVYIILAYYQPDNLPIVAACVFVEQFGYGFGFTAYMLYLIHFSQGQFKTAHYAFCTGFMALSMMLPGLGAGWLQEQVGYLNFFIIVMALVPLTFLVSAFIRVEPEYAKKDSKTEPAAQQASVLDNDNTSTSASSTKRHKNKHLWIAVLVIGVVAVVTLKMCDSDKNESTSTASNAVESETPTAREQVLDSTVTSGTTSNEETENPATDQSSAYTNTADVEQTVVRVFNGEFGNGQERKQKLGENYATVQTRVNEIQQAANHVIKGDFDNGQKRKQTLGEDYVTIQARINEMYRQGLIH